MKNFNNESMQSMLNGIIKQTAFNDYAKNLLVMGELKAGDKIDESAFDLALDTVNFRCDDIGGDSLNSDGTVKNLETCVIIKEFVLEHLQSTLLFADKETFFAFGDDEEIPFGLEGFFDAAVETFKNILEVNADVKTGISCSYEKAGGDTRYEYIGLAANILLGKAKSGTPASKFLSKKAISSPPPFADGMLSDNNGKLTVCVSDVTGKDFMKFFFSYFNLKTERLTDIFLSKAEKYYQ